MSSNTPQVEPEGVAAKLQFLATEHWSLLATGSLPYTESLGRVNVFLAILSGAVIALALVAQADHFGPTFISIAIMTLVVVLFAGIATIARLMHLNRDDFR
jgi:fucose permease